MTGTCTAYCNEKRKKSFSKIDTKTAINPGAEIWIANIAFCSQVFLQNFLTGFGNSFSGLGLCMLTKIVGRHIEDSPNGPFEPIGTQNSSSLEAKANPANKTFYLAFKSRLVFWQVCVCVCVCV